MPIEAEAGSRPSRAAPPGSARMPPAQTSGWGTRWPCTAGRERCHGRRQHSTLLQRWLPCVCVPNIRQKLHITNICQWLPAQNPPPILPGCAAQHSMAWRSAPEEVGVAKVDLHVRGVGRRVPPPRHAPPHQHVRHHLGAARQGKRGRGQLRRGRARPLRRAGRGGRSGPAGWRGCQWTRRVCE